VTPGLGAAGHILRFSKRLIKEDLPTFGYPTIPARTFQGTVETSSKVNMSWLIIILNNQQII
jgi:hypothetical protein